VIDAQNGTVVTEHPGQGPESDVPNRRIGVFGLVVVGAGVVLAVIAFTSANWIDYGRHAPSYTFANLRDEKGITGFAAAYFSWTAWLVLIVTTVFAVCGGIRVPMREACSRVGALFGVLSAAMTLAVLSDLAGAGGLSHFWKYVADGPYLAMGGFLAIAFGGFLAS